MLFLTEFGMLMSCLYSKKLILTSDSIINLYEAIFYLLDVSYIGSIGLIGPSHTGFLILSKIYLVNATVKHRFLIVDKNWLLLTADTDR